MSSNATTTQQGRDVTQEEEKKLVKLIRQRKFNAARNYADSLGSEGVPETTINSMCYDSFRILNATHPRAAKRLAGIFRDYSWECWLRQG